MWRFFDWFGPRKEPEDAESKAWRRSVDSKLDRLLKSMPHDTELLRRVDERLAELLEELKGWRDG